MKCPQAVSAIEVQGKNDWFLNWVNQRKFQEEVGLESSFFGKVKAGPAVGRQEALEKTEGGNHRAQEKVCGVKAWAKEKILPWVNIILHFCFISSFAHTSTNTISTPVPRATISIVTATTIITMNTNSETPTYSNPRKAVYLSPPVILALELSQSHFGSFVFFCFKKLNSEQYLASPVVILHCPSILKTHKHSISALAHSRLKFSHSVRKIEVNVNLRVIFPRPLTIEFFQSFSWPQEKVSSHSLLYSLIQQILIELLLHADIYRACHGERSQTESLLCEVLGQEMHIVLVIHYDVFLHINYPKTQGLTTTGTV